MAFLQWNTHTYKKKQKQLIPIEHKLRVKRQWSGCTPAIMNHTQVIQASTLVSLSSALARSLPYQNSQLTNQNEHTWQPAQIGCLSNLSASVQSCEHTKPKVHRATPCGFGAHGLATFLACSNCSNYQATLAESCKKIQH